MASQPPCPDCGRNFPPRPSTEPNCRRCQWREHNGSVCDQPFCQLCGIVFKYLKGNDCGSCASNPLALASQNSQNTASSIPHQQNHGQPLIHTVIPTTANPNDLPSHLFSQNPLATSLSAPVHQSSSFSTNNQAEELARLLTSKNRTNWPKPPITKAVLQPPKPSQASEKQKPKREGKIKMMLCYLKSMRKTRHPLEPKMCKVNLDDPHWYINLYLEAWLWFRDTADKLNWPPHDKQIGKDKLVPLPCWDDRYCQTVDNGCLIEKDDLKIQIIYALKKPSGLASLKCMGISFSWDKYQLTIPQSPLPESNEDKQDITEQPTTRNSTKRSRLDSSDDESSIKESDASEKEVVVVKQKKKQKLGPPPKPHPNEKSITASGLTKEEIEDIETDELKSNIYDSTNEAHHQNQTFHEETKLDHEKNKPDHNQTKTVENNDKTDHNENKTDHRLEPAQSQSKVKGIEQTKPQDPASKSPTALLLG
ncbi:uncharacterized protein MELLADRAFT_93129 [Melampsora larici-populina 98AG31]|uniref:Uncharacterized protein n=1 Tax=Melampsora larici-populina (strain 98AG31 / pathotype 3-4-7) TaxID=747676 RepID=F4S412_MELLP|nr:uncharacterized protein MELLADRAFT_93129 [Melampsora larici-populina 98AG31]EGG00624.1 hypothetical protein MELLADRAFT_93129 [Melampsora larici-populina 98AG31]